MTTKGNIMPVDAEPVEGGNVTLVRDFVGGGMPTAYIVGPGDVLQVENPDDVAAGYRSHFSSCPHAAQHRRQRVREKR
jgi:hypothetical protein